MMKRVTFWLAFAAVGVGRFLIPGHGLSWPGTYEAAAHIWVGWMLAAWLHTRQGRYGWAVGALTVLETVMFLTRKT